MLKQRVLDACRHMLAPIARLLIRNGIGWAEFAELGKDVFVEVARGDYGLQGRPTNTARVALMTGLSRREVTRVRKRLAGEVATEPASPNRISQVLTGWHTDPEFLGRDGRPAELPPDGERASVAALLARYAGDVPHGALLKELKGLGLVVPGAAGLRVTARDYIRSASDPDLLRQGGVALHDHAATIVHNVDTKRDAPARFERMATRIDLAAADAREFQALLEVRGQAFLEDMDTWLATRARAAGGAKPGAGVRAGVGMYAIYDENEGSSSNG